MEKRLESIQTGWRLIFWACVLSGNISITFRKMQIHLRKNKKNKNFCFFLIFTVNILFIIFGHLMMMRKQNKNNPTEPLLS